MRFDGRPLSSTPRKRIDPARCGRMPMIARNVVDHLSEREHLRPAIVVGVGYPGGVDRESDDYRFNRARDYTPTHSPEGGYGAKWQTAVGNAAP